MEYTSNSLNKHPFSSSMKSPPLNHFSTTLHNSLNNFDMLIPDKKSSTLSTKPIPLNILESSLNKTDYLCNNSQTNPLNNSLKLSQSLKNKNTKISKSTPKILSPILDDNQKYSPRTPSNLKLIQKELEIIHNNSNSIKFTYDNLNEYILISIEMYLHEINDNLNEFLTQSIPHKCNTCINYLSSQHTKVRLGSLILLYFILKKYWEEIEIDIKQNILHYIINILLTKYETQEEIFLVSCLNICSLYGPTYELLLNNTGLISMFITDFNYPYLQRAAFICLMTLEKEGLKCLINLCNTEFPEYQKYILNNLIKTPHIQKMVLVRGLLCELSTHNLNRIQESLSALNRMYDLVNDEQILLQLSKFLYQPNFKNYKRYIASILRNSNTEIGENILLNELNKSSDHQTREIVAKILGWRVMKNPPYIDITIDNNDTCSVIKNPPGCFCKYYGEISAVLGKPEDFFNEIEEDGTNNGDNDEFEESIKGRKNKQEYQRCYLEINTRDFLSALKRILNSNNINHSNPLLVFPGNKMCLLDELDFTYFRDNMKVIDIFDLILPVYDNYNNLNNNNSFQNLNNCSFSSASLTQIKQSSPYYNVSPSIIKSLFKHLSDKNEKVQTACAISLGQIALPETLPFIDNFISILKSQSTSNNPPFLIALIWMIGRCAEGTSSSLIYDPLICFLYHKMWKIKRATLYALSCFGDKISDKALPHLVKLLRETPISKNLIAEAIIKMGQKGEDTLLSIISQENTDTNYKLISAIIRAFSFCDITTPNIDFILECLFRQSNSVSQPVRKNALYTINTLAHKANETNLLKPSFNNNNKQAIVYLNYKNIIPFYYDKLKDKNNDIQSYAIYCIKNFKAQGELVFIEGLINDPNPIVRANCGCGLVECGVHSIRTLLNYGLFDKNESVRKTIEKRILEKMNVNDIISYFKNSNQLLSLKIMLIDVIEKCLMISPQFKSFCEEIIQNIDNTLNINFNIDNNNNNNNEISTK